MGSLVDLLGKGSTSIARVEIGKELVGMIGMDSKIELSRMESELREVVSVISLGIKTDKSSSSRNWLSIGAKGSGMCRMMNGISDR